MSQGSDRLHFNRVSLVERVVQDAWRVDHLPSCVLVVRMTHKQVLSCEGVRLHINIGVGNIVDKARLANVWESCDYERA